MNLCFIKKNKKFKHYANRGMGLVEVIVGLTIISVGIMSLVGAYFYYLQVMVHNTPNIQAAYLLEEGVEVMRLLRDQSWNDNIAAFSSNTASYYLDFNASTSKWFITTSVVSLIDDQFDRKINISPAYRDANNNLVLSDAPGATMDTSTALITAQVSWKEGESTTTKTLSTYLTNIFGN